VLLELGMQQKKEPYYRQRQPGELIQHQSCPEGCIGDPISNQVTVEFDLAVHALVNNISSSFKIDLTELSVVTGIPGQQVIDVLARVPCIEFDVVVERGIHKCLIL